MTTFTTSITPFLLTIIAGFGVLMHDTQIDKAAISAMRAPASIVGSIAPVATPELRLNEQHIHTENLTDSIRKLTTSEPRLQTRFTDEKKYLALKKMMVSNTNGLDI